MNPMDLKLWPELVPSPLWGLSASRLLRQSVWRRVRARHLDTAGHACEVCGKRQQKGLVCHERWHHDHPGATLVALRMQCRPCDYAVHVGLADTRGNGRIARAQLMRVNGIDAATAEVLIEAAYERHAGQSALTGWTVRVASPLLSVHPELAELPDLAARAAAPE